MTDVLPSVSTMGRRRTSAFRLTMRRTPIASEIVTTAGSASGTTATARAMPNMNIWITGQAAQQTNGDDQPDDDQCRLAERATQTIEVLLQWCPGDLYGVHHSGNAPELGCHAGRGDHALPAAVSDHGARVGHVPAVAQREPWIVEGADRLLGGLRFTCQSAASSTARLTDCVSRVSAGTRSPARSTTTSPGTRSRAGTTVS